MAVVSVSVSGRSYIHTWNANPCPLIHGDRPIIDIYRTVFASIFLVRNRSNVTFQSSYVLYFSGL